MRALSAPDHEDLWVFGYGSLMWRPGFDALERVPGTIVVEALEPIPPGLGRATFMAQLESTLEQATARLVAEARTKNQGSSST